jgi:hypothetical protein
VDAIEARASITDPEGNTVTSLSNPVRVTEEASTFAENNLNISLNNSEVNDGSVILKNSTIVDDFEDADVTVKSNDWSGWNGDAANLSAQNGTIIAGSFSGELTSSNADVNIDAQAPPSLTKDISASVQIGSDTGSSGDYSIVGFDNNSGGLLGNLAFNDQGGAVFPKFGSAKTVLTSWSPGQIFDLRFSWDFGNDQVEIFVNGSSKGFFPFFEASSSIESIKIRNRTDSSGSTRDLFIDDVIAGQNKNSGDVLIEFDSGAPADIDSYDLATFQRTLDNETVTIDIEDGNGNVLFSDISQDFDISSVNPSKNVKLRAVLSRVNTSNNPTVDYLARRFTR